MSEIANPKSEVDVTATSSGAEFNMNQRLDEIYVDPVVEKRAMRKFDKYMLPQIVILLLISFLDRSNVGNARVFGFEATLGFVGNQFGNINTIFYVSYVVFEIPWVMAIKKWGANTVIAIAFVSWSMVTIGTGFIKNYGQAIAVRFLLGAFEAGLFPGLTFFLSTVYSREAQGTRVAVLYAAGALSGAFGGLIAYGIQLMGDRRGLEAWRWLFIIEGSVSAVICGVAWFTLPTNAEKAWFLTEEERDMMKKRKQRDIIFKGDDEFSWQYLKMAFRDLHIYIAAICLFCSSIPLFGFSVFLPSIIKGLGYTSVQANYLTIPVYFGACITLFGGTYVSDRFGKRALIAFISPPLVMLGYAIVLGSTNIGAGYFAMFMIACGIYPYNAVMYTWVSNNLKPDYKRSVGIPLFTSLSNISGMLSSQIYPASGAPRYIMGNAVSLGMESIAMIGVVIIFFLLRFRNLKKEKLINEGVTNNGKEGDKALDFKYIL